MAFTDSISVQRARGLAFQGAGLLLFLIMISQLHVHIASLSVTFAFLPITAVFLWPRLAEPLTTILSLFILGLLMDCVNEGPLGFWPLIFMTYFIIFRPDRREGQQGFIGLWLGFGIVAILLLMLMVGISLALVGYTPNLMALSVNLGVTLAVFPLIFVSVRALGRRSSDGSSAGFVV